MNNGWVFSSSGTPAQVQAAVTADTDIQPSIKEALGYLLDYTVEEKSPKVIVNAAVTVNAATKPASQTLTLAFTYDY